MLTCEKPFHEQPKEILAKIDQMPPSPEKQDLLYRYSFDRTNHLINQAIATYYDAEKTDNSSLQAFMENQKPLFDYMEKTYGFERPQKRYVDVTLDEYGNDYLEFFKKDAFYLYVLENVQEDLPI